MFLKSDEFDPHKEGTHMFTHLPLGLKMEVEDVTFSTGGNATNVAVTFARQGLQASYMWHLAMIRPAKLFSTHWMQKVSNTSAVVQDERYQSGYSVILIATNGERTILNDRGYAGGEHPKS